MSSSLTGKLNLSTKHIDIYLVGASLSPPIFLVGLPLFPLDSTILCSKLVNGMVAPSLPLCCAVFGLGGPLSFPAFLLLSNLLDYF